MMGSSVSENTDDSGTVRRNASVRQLQEAQSIVDKKFLGFMKPEGSLLCRKKSTTGPYAETD
jgi:hypothetical protein